MKFEVYQGKGRKKRWYWRLVAANGEIIADGAQGYSTRQNCRRAVTKLKKAVNAKVPVETISPKKK
jgi:uncharacterized protein YegP (UPF0339 family)